ncbi:MAG: MtaA/CmuA family methyltransferase, partial [Armatimonadetes bacterium]|nr:MtaA/CmuA family methyltransferase [Armatimonadota bacterium]
MTARQRFLSALSRQPTDTVCVANPTSIATADLMEQTGCFFPEAHLEAGKMATLAAAGHDLLGYDTVAPYFSVINEAAALGCAIDWGDATHMPTVRSHIFREPDDI